jgi:hypothetical protein
LCASRGASQKAHRAARSVRRLAATSFLNLFASMRFTTLSLRSLRAGQGALPV